MFVKVSSQKKSLLNFFDVAFIEKSPRGKTIQSFSEEANFVKSLNKIQFLRFKRQSSTSRRRKYSYKYYLTKQFYTQTLLFQSGGLQTFQSILRNKSTLARASGYTFSTKSKTNSKFSHQMWDCNHNSKLLKLGEMPDYESSELPIGTNVWLRKKEREMQLLLKC